MSYFVLYCSYLYISCSGSITSVGEERAKLFLLSFRVHLSLFVIGIGCIILLWHSVGLPYNYSAGFLAVRPHHSLLYAC